MLAIFARYYCKRFVVYKSRKILPEPSFKPSPMLITTIGYASVIFFGVCGMFIFRKLFDTKAGIIIDDKGIHDNSSGSIGRLYSLE
jgi:hypothetical protein